MPTQNSEKVPNSCTQVTFMRNREQKRKMAPHEYFFRQKKKLVHSKYSLHFLEFNEKKKLIEKMKKDKKKVSMDQIEDGWIFLTKDEKKHFYQFW